MRTGLVVLALLGWACGDDGRAPLTASGGGPHSGPITPRDSGADDDAGAAADAAIGAPISRECERTDVVLIRDDSTPAVTGTAAPSDFRVTRQAATWRGECDDPIVAVELSGGSCPRGDGHELEILLVARAVEDGLIAFGRTELLPEPDSLGLRVRYVRPDGLEPAGTWGGCAGSGGELNFYDAPDVSRSGRLRAGFSFDLTGCDDPGRLPIRVEGYFDVALRRARSSVCR